GAGRGHQPRNRTELALPGQLVHDHAQLGHDGIVLLLAPGAGHLLIVVAKYCVLHARTSPLPQGRASMPEADREVEKMSPGRARPGFQATIEARRRAASWASAARAAQGPRAPQPPGPSR